MRFKFSIITVLLAALLIGGAGAYAQKDKGQGKGQGQGMGRGEGAGRGEGSKQDAKKQNQVTIATADTVNVTLSTGGGKISVRGWDRREVRAASKDADARIETHATGGGDANNPPTRVEILVSDKSDDEDAQCNSDIDMILDVPRGATVYLKTQDGDVDVTDVAEAHIETSGGRIEMRRISKATEATTVGGDITLEEASGRARLTALGGVIEVKGVRLLDTSDFLKVRTVSGDILLEEIGPARVQADTTSGVVKMTGPLAHGGNYTFNTTTGDVTLELPSDSSFKLNAKVFEGGEIVTEFPLKYKGPVSPGSLLQSGRLLGTYGSGDATINLVSFSGTLRLRKK